MAGEGTERLQGLNVLHVGSVRPKNDVTNPSDNAEDSLGIYRRPSTATNIALQRFFFSLPSLSAIENLIFFYQEKIHMQV